MRLRGMMEKRQSN